MLKVKLQMPETALPLPPGYTVTADDCVGVSYFDASGKVVMQHPKDCDAARRFVWAIMAKRAKMEVTNGA